MKRTHIETELHVAGRGEFPADMLCYDRCCPSSQADVHAMGVYLDGGMPARIVTLRRFTEDGRPASSDRWRSFGWTVLSSAQVTRVKMSSDPQVTLRGMLGAEA